MKKMLTTLHLLIPIAVWAQDSMVKKPDFFESVGKIYVVVGVLATILVGIILFLVSLERKVKRLEQMTDRTDETN